MKDFVQTRVASKSVALTFDDGPDPRWTPAVLAALDRVGSRATFFVIAGAEPALVQRIAAEGHEVGYHCGRHVRHSFRKREEVASEVERDLAWLDDLGIRPQAWRTPWGDVAPWTHGIAGELGLELWGWSDDTHDWAGLDAETMLADLRPTLGGGSVVLMHDGLGPGALRTDALETAALIAPLVERCSELGLMTAPIADVERASAVV